MSGSWTTGAVFLTDITYTKKGGKYVFCKDGVYFSLTPEQVWEMAHICKGIVHTKDYEDMEVGG